MLLSMAIVEFRVAYCRYDEGLQDNPSEPSKGGGPLHRTVFPPSNGEDP
jgi:hypothetical protein